MKFFVLLIVYIIVLGVAGMVSSPKKEKKAGLAIGIVSGFFLTLLLVFRQ